MGHSYMLQRNVNFHGFVSQQDATCGLNWYLTFTYLLTHRLYQRPMEWNRANGFCTSLGAKLQEIDSSVEKRAILGEINKKGYHRQKMHFWLGLTDRRREGEWVYESTLKEPRFKNWAFKQPDDGGKFGTEDCAYINTDNLRWKDWSCRRKRYLSWTLNALCEKLWLNLSHVLGHF